MGRNTSASPYSERDVGADASAAPAAAGNTLLRPDDILTTSPPSPATGAGNSDTSAPPRANMTTTGSGVKSVKTPSSPSTKLQGGFINNESAATPGGNQPFPTLRTNVLRNPIATSATGLISPAASDGGAPASAPPKGITNGSREESLSVEHRVSHCDTGGTNNPGCGAAHDPPHASSFTVAGIVPTVVGGDVTHQDSPRATTPWLEALLSKAARPIYRSPRQQSQKPQSQQPRLDPSRDTQRDQNTTGDIASAPGPVGVSAAPGAVASASPTQESYKRTGNAKSTAELSAARTTAALVARAVTEDMAVAAASSSAAADTAPSTSPPPPMSTSQAPWLQAVFSSSPTAGLIPCPPESPPPLERSSAPPASSKKKKIRGSGRGDVGGGRSTRAAPVSKSSCSRFARGQKRQEGTTKEGGAEVVKSVSPRPTKPRKTRVRAQSLGPKPQEVAGGTTKGEKKRGGNGKSRKSGGSGAAAASSEHGVLKEGEDENGEREEYETFCSPGRRGRRIFKGSEHGKV